jgi:hypothetical protein
MMHLDLEAEFLAGLAHRGAQVLEPVHGRHREIAALDARAVSHVAALVAGARVPRALHGIDVIAAAIDLVGPAHAVEDEEFVLGSEQAAVRDAGGLQIGLGAFSERARVAVVALHRRRFDDVAAQKQRGLLEERIDHRGGGIRHQDHVGLIDALPSGDRRAVKHLAVDEEILIDHARRDRDVLFLAARVRKAQVAVGGFFFLDELYDVGRGHGNVLQFLGAIARDPLLGARGMPL